MASEVATAYIQVITKLFTFHHQPINQLFAVCQNKRYQIDSQTCHLPVRFETIELAGFCLTQGKFGLLMATFRQLL